MTAKHMSELPTAPGTYNVAWKGWRTFGPVFMKFDGKEWVDLDKKRNHYFQPTGGTSWRDSTDIAPGEFHWFPNA